MLRLILFFGVMLDLSKLTEIVPLCSNRLGDARFVHTNAFKNQMINIECVFFFFIVKSNSKQTVGSCMVTLLK